MLKPFLPQLQTTFLKALNDTNRTVRLKAGLEKTRFFLLKPSPVIFGFFWVFCVFWGFVVFLIFAQKREFLGFFQFQEYF
jgi:hypothetical protein